MCLIILAKEYHPGYPFIFAANRDERHDRPTGPAHFWEDEPGIIAGRDQVAGGTWCGVTRGGRFAAVSNFRDGSERKPDAPSRGHLVRDFLTDDRSPRQFLETLEENASAYNGFNLLVGDLPDGRAGYFSNRGGAPEILGSGLFGLSNHLLDTPWPKVRLTKRRFRAAVDPDGGGSIKPDDLFDILRSTDRPPDEELPETGLDLAAERLVSAPFIVSPTYGTRSSTVILLERGGTLRFVEQSYDPAGNVSGRVDERMMIGGRKAAG